MSTTAATVHVTNIAHSTTEDDIRKFFTFCGKIEDLSVTPSSGSADSTLSATVTFAQPSAARTALLLDNTDFGGKPIHVEAGASLDDLSHSAEDAAHAHHDSSDDIRQEDKPRTAIFAEYLSQGYTISDKALQRGIELDEKHGITSRFTSYLTGLDSRLKATDKARAADNTYGITNKANQGYTTVARYFESALNTPTGQKVRDFYNTGSKQVLDIHNEARRLADMRLEKSKCTCGGAEGKCNCPGGKCTCAGCSKPGPGEKGGADTTTTTTASSGSSGLGGGYKKEAVKVGEGKTHCTCGGAEGVCGCPAGQCTCSGCSVPGPH